MGILKKEFYQRANVVAIAKDLLGKMLITEIDGHLTSGMIVETEAYSSREQACHAFNGRKTKRNAVMYETGGIAYVYFIYGIHFMFNVVTNSNGSADAVLIRALAPVDGIKIMQERRKKITPRRITSGPGALTKAMGINQSINGLSLDGKLIRIEDNRQKKSKFEIVCTRRIGVDYAGEDADLPWRFYIKNDPWVSKT